MLTVKPKQTHLAVSVLQKKKPAADWSAGLTARTSDHGERSLAGFPEALRRYFWMTKYYITKRNENKIK